MTNEVLATHPPAVKIGGRRLSISSKPKPHVPTEPAPATPGIPADYPRPVHSDAQAPPHHEEEAPPKREMKHSNYENEKLLRDLKRRKSEPTRPSKELLNSAHKVFGGAGRIAQPAGKAFGV